MFCPNCGAPNPETVNNCGTCGAAVSQAPLQQHGAPQPMMSGGGYAPHIENYLVLSILSTVFCCWPLGIVAIINAASVSTKAAQGDIQGAMLASKRAKNWSIASIVSVAVLGVFYLIFVGVAVAAGGM